MTQSGNRVNQPAHLQRLEHAVAESPGDLAHWLRLIEALLQLGRIEEALARTRDAIAVIGDQPGLLQLSQTLARSLEPTSTAESWAEPLQDLKTSIEEGDYARALRLGTAFTQQWADQSQGWDLLAEACYRSGDYDAALDAARRAVAITPESGRLHANLGVMLKAVGALDQAEQSLRLALARDPGLTAAHINLGSLLRERGELEAAEASFRQAAVLAPTQAETHYNLANLLDQLERRQEAEAEYREALRLNPQLAAAANNLGILLGAANRLEEARDFLEQAIVVAPHLTAARTSLGEVLRALGHSEEAAEVLRAVVAADPEQTRAWYQLGITLANLGCFDEAQSALLTALRLEPKWADALEFLEDAREWKGERAQAAQILDRVTQLTPQDAAMMVALGDVCANAGQLQQAEATYRAAMALEPSLAAPYVGLGHILNTQQRYHQALEELDVGLRLDSECAAAHATRGRVLMELGRLEEAETAYRRAVRIEPNDGILRSRMLVSMAFNGHWSPARMRAEAEQWEPSVLSAAERQVARDRVFHRAPRQGRKLRIGLLSNELQVHPAAYFLLSWVQALNRADFELFIYPAQIQPGELQDRFKPHADTWVSLAGLSDAQAAERLLADELDVLVETSGHEAGHRLGVIARRVAPVQCHYIGYYATTGISQMDYFIGDTVLIPPAHDDHFTETVWRLPRTRYAYQTLEPAPEPRWWPDPGGRIWVGSFNNLFKVRDASLELWAQVLHALPEAHLALKDRKGANRPLQLRVLRTLERCGIPENRVSFMDFAPFWAAHMAYYNRLDVALDTSPFNSATTGFDALWMGCPLVTLVGDCLAGRQAASLLTGLGRAEWVTESAADFVQVAVELALDRARRRRIRQSQRQRMAGSELCDGPGLARVLEDSFVRMFEHWQRGARR